MPASWNRIVSWLQEIDGLRRPSLYFLDPQGSVSVLKVSDEPFEFGFLAQGFEVWVDFEEGPARETGVDAAFQPRHRLVRFPSTAYTQAIW